MRRMSRLGREGESSGTLLPSVDILRLLISLRGRSFAESYYDHYRQIMSMEGSMRDGQRKGQMERVMDLSFSLSGGSRLLHVGFCRV